MQSLHPASVSATIAAAKSRMTADNLAADRPAPLFIGSEVFRRAAFSGNHPLNIVRHTAVLDLVRILGWLPSNSFRSGTPATLEKLLRFHDRAYVEALQYADSTGKVAADIRERYQIGTFENPLFPGLFERAATTVGGSILAAQLACDGHVVFHPSGGTHHGRKDRASGFCYFNDPVFAILTLLDEGCENVLYVDLDAHHGDGVEEAFRADTRVTTISVHEENRWPYSGKAVEAQSPGVINLPVPRGMNDSELEFLMDRVILPVARLSQTDALVVCCGADCLQGDPLSGMMLSNVALWQAVDSLIALRRPSVILGGGGYNPWTVTRYWAGLWGSICGKEMPEPLPEEASDLLRGMECELVDEDEVDPRWFTSIADSAYPGPIRDPIRSIAATVTV